MKGHDPAELVDFYRRVAYRKGILSREEIEDFSQEMYLRAMILEKRKGIPRQKFPARLLWGDAFKKIIPWHRRMRRRNMDRYAEVKSVGIEDLTQESYAEFLSSLWNPASQWGRSKQYLVRCNEFSLHLSAEEIKEVIGAGEWKERAEVIVGNVKQRGRLFYLVDDRLFRTMKDALHAHGLKYRRELERISTITKLRFTVV